MFCWNKRRLEVSSELSVNCKGLGNPAKMGSPARPPHREHGLQPVAGCVLGGLQCLEAPGTRAFVVPPVVLRIRLTIIMYHY